MARARNLKPGIFKNEILGEADPLLSLLFMGLWGLADREGRLEDRPKRIKAEIFPYREIPDFNGYLTELASMGFIQRYQVSGVPYIQVVNFAKHQSPHKTEKPSEIPKPPEESDTCAITENAPLSNESPTVKESLTPDSLCTDSLYKNSMSGNAENGLVNKQPDYPEQADRVLTALNHAAGKRFRLNTTNRTPIIARLKDGFTEQDCLRVVSNRVQRWGGTEHAQYLRPDTLFRPSKFESYLNDTGESGQSRTETASERMRRKLAENERTIQ